MVRYLDGLDVGMHQLIHECQGEQEEIYSGETVMCSRAVGIFSGISVFDPPWITIELTNL